MKNSLNRRRFIKAAGIAGIGFSLSDLINPLSANAMSTKFNSKRIGIIGLDTSHSVAFTKSLNNPSAAAHFAGYKVVAAYPKGSNDIPSSVERIPGYIEDVKKLGVEIVDSVKELLNRVDFVLLETNDGRLHLEQALEVIKAGKPFFIDKPIAASLADAIAIFKAAEKKNVPVFSSSSLRYTVGAQEIANGKVGRVLGADTFSPIKIEKTHPDLFWYGIHGVETLFTVLGTGCKTVSRIRTEISDVSTGIWEDGKIGTFRGHYNGRQDYGGTAFGEKGAAVIGAYGGYDPLLVKIIEFFESGKVPVSKEETLEICAFMEAADESIKNGGKPVSIASIFQRASAKLK
ncbi:Gfo/Idh/MocA family oxidoreductase [Daejeonella sp. H1SJ63]|jgi:predicted dehydrogenase|uniref:Gfo/Idh/MocA family protein n=1 Tax=Daejeonella sp. H1SJ63 TaxID=3034145 RepID=UPI0023EC2884|nr:Gfo/Idh/MocA family oxidoreductase [Daejeonella sp. H1SJ63]